MTDCCEPAGTGPDRHWPGPAAVSRPALQLHAAAVMVRLQRGWRLTHGKEVVRLEHVSVCDESDVRDRCTAFGVASSVAAARKQR